MSEVPPMSEPMTMEEIEALYDREWVLLAEIESDFGPIFRRARVVWHSKDEAECWARIDGSPRVLPIGVLWIGTIRADEEPILML